MHYIELGRVYAQMGKKAEAKELFKRAAGWNFNGAQTALVKNEARKRAG